MSDDLDRALQLLGSLERRIMRAVWSGAVPSPFSGRQMLDQVPGIAYTTATTTLNRLAEKGLLLVETASGPRPFTYRALGRPEDFLAPPARARSPTCSTATGTRPWRHF